MSLSAWFRDYVYVPLGGNRAGTSRLYVNLVTVFFLCGLWHGASWTFVIWGLFHGTFLVIERLGLARRVQSLWSPLRHAYLLIVVMVGWVFFRAETLPGALGVLGAMMGLGPAEPTIYDVTWYLTPEVVVALIAGAIAAAPVAPMVGKIVWTDGADEASVRFGWLPSAAMTAGLFVLLAASVMLSAARTYNPFIYFRF
jgi:alginate O-acetyltransferase complex protein AlgI